MKFTKRDDILVAWGKDGIQYYIPLVQSLKVNIGTNVSTITQSGTYKKRQEILTAPTIEIPIEILGKDNIINEEFYFLNSPDETERQIFNDINSPIDIFVLLNDKNEYDDLIKVVESVSDGESHDVYCLEINNCYLNSYSLSIEAGSLITHNLSLSGNKIEGKRVPIANTQNNKSLAPKNIGLASNFNLYTLDGLFNQPVSSFSISLDIDRKIKYLFAKREDISNNTNNDLAPKINRAESSSYCTLNISTISDLKSKDFTTEYLRNAESLLKNFRIIHDEPSINNAPIRTSINFYDATLNSVEVEENIDGFMNISYSFNVVVPTETLNNDIRKGITTRKRYEKYIPAVKTQDLSFINPDYQNDFNADKAWDWEIPNLVNATDAFNGVKTIKEFNTQVCPELKIGERMFKDSSLVSCKCLFPKLENARGMFMSSSLKMFNQELPSLTMGDELFRASSVEEVTIKKHKIINFNTALYAAREITRINMDFSTVTSMSYLAEGSGLIEFKHNLSNVYNIGNAFMSNNRMKEFNSALPEVLYASNSFRWSRELHTFRYPIDENGNSIYESGKTQAINSDGTGIYSYLTLPKVVSLQEAFSYMTVDFKSALSIIKSLRQRVDGIASSSWIITMSMENTYQNNIELANAIEQAKTKGWTVIMQWQTPRARGLNISNEGIPPFLNQKNLFLLKKIEDENGIFEDEFGKRFEIIGGNEVYSEWGRTSQLGYEIFSSYEEAMDKWKLVYKGSMLP